MHDIDTDVFKYVFKMGIVVYLLSNTFNMTMAVFDAYTCGKWPRVLSHDTAIDVTTLTHRQKRLWWIWKSEHWLCSLWKAWS